MSIPCDELEDDLGTIKEETEELKEKPTILYITGSGIQPYNSFVAEALGATKFDTQFYKPSFKWRYLKFINLPLMFIKIPKADYYLCESWWDIAFATIKKMLGGKHRTIALWVFPLAIHYDGMPFMKKALLPIQRFLSRYIDYAVVDSEMNLHEAKAVCQNPNCMFVNAYPFVNEDVYQYKVKVKDLSKNNFINVSRDTEEKGLRNLEKIFYSVNPEYKLTILNQFCTEITTNGNITTRGKVPIFHEYLQDFTYYPTYPNMEMLGVAQLECMALGIIPLIGGKCGLSEILKEEGLDILLANDKDDMIRKIEWAASLPIEERQKLSNQVRGIARKFTRERTRIKIKELSLQLR